MSSLMSLVENDLIYMRGIIFLGLDYENLNLLHLQMQLDQQLSSIMHVGH